MEMSKIYVEFCEKLFALGVITSPNYPGNYPNTLEKTETIQVEQGLILLLQFNAFDIEKPDFDYNYDTSEYDLPYCYDHLTITDGDGTTLMEKSSGSTIPANITSSSNIVKLVFITGQWNSGQGLVPVPVYWTRTGWRLSWSAVTPGECQ